MEKIITIPKQLVNQGELVIIPRKYYEILVERQKVTTKDILRWTKEAKLLKKTGALPKLNSWAKLAQ